MTKRRRRGNIQVGPVRSGFEEAALPARGNGFGQHHPCRVNSLKYSFQVHPPRDLPDEHRGHALRTQLLVNAQEVYFHHPLQSAQDKGDNSGENCQERLSVTWRARREEASRVVDAYVRRDGTDEAHQLLVGGHSHSAVPLGQPAGRTQGPARATDGGVRCEVASRPRLIKQPPAGSQTRAPFLGGCLPLEKVWRVIESEHVFVVLYVVLV